MDRNKLQRVGIGVGTFHNPPRAKYSEDTRNLIKLLMDESKLSMMQRKSIERTVDRGESLPPTSSRSTTSSTGKSQHQVTLPCCYWKKRSQNVIASSGAYEREQYRRTAPLPDKELQKRHLACMMAYGKDVPPTPTGPPRSLPKPTAKCQLPDDVDPFRDLVQGIGERIEFLNDMERLGQGKKYRPIIHQEIAQKIRMIESLDKSAEFSKQVEYLKYERPPPKPYPMGELD